MNDQDTFVALLRWLEDQGLSPRDAAMLCAKVCGILAIQENQVDWLCSVMRATNHAAHATPTEERTVQ